MSRVVALVALAIVALAASAAAQNCVVTIQDYGTDSSCTSLNASTPITQGVDTCISSANYPYIQAQCLDGFTTSSRWIVDIWSPALGGCTGSTAGRAQGTSYSQCSTFNSGSATSAVSYFRVNCSCVTEIPAVSSSSGVQVSSSSAGSTGLSSSAANIDYGCPATVTSFTDGNCGTAVATYNPVSRVCTPFAVSGTTQYYISLACTTPGQLASNWAAAVYADAACRGNLATSFTSDPAAPNSCRTGSAVGSVNYYINVNCSCVAGRRYSSTGIISSTGLSTGVSGATSVSGLTGVSGATSITGNTASTGSSSTTGSSSSAPASRSSVVAIVAAAAAGVVALLA